jgi:hypothetical protein
VKVLIHLARSGSSHVEVWCGAPLENVQGMANFYALATCRVCRGLALAEADASVREYRRQRSIRLNVVASSGPGDET